MNENLQRQPPIARKEHKETSLHGTVLTDDYAWLRDKQNPEVTAYLEAENAYAEAVMAPLAGLRDDLYQEMLSHVKQTDVSVPFRDGGWWYCTRTEEGLQYAIHCRRRGTAFGPENDAPEQVILDGNQLAEGHAFFAIGATDITAMAAGWPTPQTRPASASTRCTSRIWKPARAGRPFSPSQVERVGSVVWAADNRHALLHRRGRGAEAPVPALAPHAGRPALCRCTGLPGRRRALQPGRGTHPRRQVHCDGISQPHHHRIVGAAGRRT